jgi:diguanylate cyclase (GGDEF)-like protein
VISPAEILQGNILIVDDHPSDVELLVQLLRGAGYTRVSSTMDPRAVGALHHEHHYDLILLDLEMPRMDGFAVMESLKTIERDGYLPVLAVTAEPGHKIRALQGGAKDFVSKPFDHAEVLMRVHNLLEVRLLHETSRAHAKLLESMALQDQLTGLANRHLLADRMSRALLHAQRNKSLMAVIYVDLDGFKQLNDTLGHGAGDTLLRSVAERLLGTVRKEDTVARAGGDEFILVLWHISGPDHAAAVAGKVLEALAQPYRIEDHAVHITCSAGIGIYPMHGTDAETLTRHADLALNDAKRAGKNVVRIAEREALDA